jgi:hypothetical protein
MYDSPQMINTNPEFKSEPYIRNQIQTSKSELKWTILICFGKESWTISRQFKGTELKNASKTVIVNEIT